MLPARHRVRIPTGRRGSIIDNRRAGDGVYCTKVAEYAATIPSGIRIWYDTARSAVDITILPPALSPAKQIRSPVQPV
jgi:hypothetical protein